MAESQSLGQWSEYLRFVLFWPLILWKKAVMPESDLYLPLEALFITIIYNILVFSLLTYAFLRWRNIPKQLP